MSTYLQDTGLNKENVKRAGEIVEEHKDVIYQSIHSMVNDHSIKDDFFHNFFLSLVRKPIPGKVKNVRAYIFRAVKNDIIDQIRKRNTYKKKLSGLARKRDEELFDKDREPEHELVVNEESERMINLINDTLPEHEAKAVLLRHFHGLSIDRIAENMNVNKRSISRYVCMGLKHLREHPELKDNVI